MPSIFFIPHCFKSTIYFKGFKSFAFIHFFVLQPLNPNHEICRRKSSINIDNLKSFQARKRWKVRVLVFETFLHINYHLGPYIRYTCHCTVTLLSHSIMASQSVGSSTVCSMVCSSKQQEKTYNCELLSLCKGNPPVMWPVDSPNKGPVIYKALTWHDLIICSVVILRQTSDSQWKVYLPCFCQHLWNKK